jgi:acyl transferase domain-containing protein
VILESSPLSHHNVMKNNLSTKPALLVLPFSANCEYSLNANIAAHTSPDTLGQYDIWDVAYTLGSRRSTFFHRGFSVVSTEGGASTLHEVVTGKQMSSEAKIGFIFSGEFAKFR